MILIVTHKTDYTVDFVVEKLNEHNVPYFRLNCEDILLDQSISISKESAFRPVINNDRHFDSVWFRRTKYPELPDTMDASSANYCYIELDAYFSNLWETISADKWLSKPSSIYRAENKILQLKEASELGFNTPDTIIPTSFEELKSFFDKCQEKIIIKPLFDNKLINNNSQSLIFTTLVSREDIESFKTHYNLPSIYQEYIEKEIEIRVTIVGNDCFAAYVESQVDEETKIDWRRKKKKFKEFELPDEIKQKCFKLIEKLNISFGAIDLILDKSGKFIFLEINPNGQWAWIESDTDLKISDSIITFLKPN